MLFTILQRAGIACLANNGSAIRCQPSRAVCLCVPNADVQTLHSSTGWHVHVGCIFHCIGHCTARFVSVIWGHGRLVSGTSYWWELSKSHSTQRNAVPLSPIYGLTRCPTSNCCRGRRKHTRWHIHSFIHIRLIKCLTYRKPYSNDKGGKI